MAGTAGGFVSFHDRDSAVGVEVQVRSGPVPEPVGGAFPGDGSSSSAFQEVFQGGVRDEHFAGALMFDRYTDRHGCGFVVGPGEPHHAVADFDCDGS